MTEMIPYSHDSDGLWNVGAGCTGRRVTLIRDIAFDQVMGGLTAVLSIGSKGFRATLLYN